MDTAYDARRQSPLAAATEIDASSETTLEPLTLMELVDAVSEASETEEEVLATVTYMLRSGRVRLAAGEESQALLA